MPQTRSRKAGHGRWETRTLWALYSPDLNASVGTAGSVGQPWPGVRQVLRQQRVVQGTARPTGLPRTRTEVAYAITSLGPEQASAADLLVRWQARGHSENRLHGVRDVTLGEGASPLHLGQAPLVALRTAVLALLPHVPAASLAAAQRHLALHPPRVLDLFHRLTHTLTRAAQTPVSPLRQRPPPATAPPRTLPTPQDTAWAS